MSFSIFLFSFNFIHILRYFVLAKTIRNTRNPNMQANLLAKPYQIALSIDYKYIFMFIAKNKYLSTSIFKSLNAAIINCHWWSLRDSISIVIVLHKCQPNPIDDVPTWHDNMFAREDQQYQFVKYWMPSDSDNEYGNMSSVELLFSSRENFDVREPIAREPREKRRKINEVVGKKSKIFVSCLAEWKFVFFLHFNTQQRKTLTWLCGSVETIFVLRRKKKTTEFNYFISGR